MNLQGVCIEGMCVKSMFEREGVWLECVVWKVIE